MTNSLSRAPTRFQRRLLWVTAATGLLLLGLWGWPRWQNQRALNHLVQSGALLDSSHDRPVWLRLSGRQVRQTDLDAVRRLDQLQRVYLDESNISDRQLAVFGRLRNLEVLSLNQTGISDDGLSYLQGLPALKELHLDGAYRVTDLGLQTLSKFPMLSDLRIRETPVTLDGLIRLSGAIPTLQIDSTHGVLGNRKLALSGTRSTDEALIRLRSATGLTGLELPSRIGDNGLPHLYNLGQLRFLVLSKTQTSSEGLGKLLSHLSRLEELDLTGCLNLTDIGLAGVEFSLSLREITLDDTAAGPRTLAVLKRLKHLELLSLVGCRSVTDDALIELIGSQENPTPALESLRFLRLGGTSITDQGLPAPRTTLKRLEGLDLQDTQVTTPHVQALRKALPRCTILH